jgi:predicted ATPase
MRSDLPSGTVTFLFTDIEGSTKLLDEVGEARYSEALAEHRLKLRNAFARHGGVEVDTQGDAFFYAFADPGEAVAAAAEGQEALAAGPVRVRMGLHTGQPRLTREGYVGREVHRGARIASAGHGGQVVLSKETREQVTVEVTDLGEHRVKDFAEPVWIFQLGSERFPPLKTISNTNLPRAASSFVGRETEVEDILSLLKDGARLLTLTGPGGSGKTRLAIEAAAELVPDFKNGVFWVGLASLRDPALVVDTIAQILGAKERLAEHVGEREMLLLLDNLEHVVQAAPELASLVEACPNLKVLTTSRELLRVRGEVEYPVPPLAEPDAVELFTSRSRLEADATIAELCRRLDNLPLAVELAAARTSVLSPAQILERISLRLDLLKGGRDAEARQQTLRATIEWSHDLLSEEEKALFARLAVFAGGYILETAEEVADANLDTLQSLVDKSLLRHSDERFSMLETIREYALERLKESGEADDLRRRHAEHFLALAEEAEPSILGVSPGEWLDRLEREHDNLRAALDWLESSAETQLALQLAGTIWEFWCLRGHFPEGWRRLENLLRADERPTRARAKALTGAGHLAPGAGVDPATQRLRSEEALALHREVGDPWAIAFAEYEFAVGLAMAGDFAAARPLVLKSVRRLREVGDVHRALQAARMVAWCHLELGELERAKAFYEELLRDARSAGDQQMEARALATLSQFATDDERNQDALDLLREAYRLDREFGDPFEIANDLAYFARALAFSDRAATAVRLVSLYEAMCEERGIPQMSWVAKISEDAMSRARARLDDAAFAEAWEEGRKLTADGAVALALGGVGSDA